MYFSHPDRTLKEHLEGLKDVIDYLLPSKLQNYWEPSELKDLMWLLIAFHDIAKATPYFQYRLARAIKDENPTYFDKHFNEVSCWLNHQDITGLAESEIRQLSRHTLFGAVTTQQAFITQDLNIDHLIYYQIIRSHHGNLPDFQSHIFSEAFFGENEIDFQKQFDKLNFKQYFTEVASSFKSCYPDYLALKERFGRQRKIISILSETQKKKSTDHYLKTQFLYSLLLSADKGDVMLGQKSKMFKRIPIPSTIVDSFKEGLPGGKDIDMLRDEAYHQVIENLTNNLDANFFEITLPTGLGKTFTAYKAALLLKENLPTHRIVYCLPFTSIIDQNGALLKEILKKSELSENLATLHHYLSPPQEKNNTEDNLHYQEAEYLTEGWENELIVTTFVQFFESIFTNKNRSLRKFHNLVNAVVILDEIQNFNPIYIEVIEEIFKKMAEHFNTKFLFVTATQPVILSDRIISLTNSPGKSKSHFFDGMNRIVLNQTMLLNGPISIEELINEILKGYKEYPSRSILIIVNTKTFSQEIFDILIERLPLKCLYLSASLIPFHRKKVIEEVKLALKPLCLVSTQVVEAGVDIDFDTVYREFAPMDSINQAAGRCNRNGTKGIGDVKIFARDRKTRIYNDILLGITREILLGQPEIIKESQLFNINQLYFAKVKSRIQQDSNESKKLMTYIYGLQFEKIAKDFRIIEETYEAYNFFIEVNEDSKIVWQEYLNSFSITNIFERKAALKKLKPRMLEFVVSIPAYAIDIEEMEKQQAIVYRTDWENFYDLQKGVLQKSGSTPTYLMSF